MISRLIPRKDGVNLFLVESQKKSDQETILFIHGYPDTHKSWTKQFDYFSNKYHVAAFDIRGAGKSTPPSNRSGYRIQYLLEDVDYVIAELVGENEKIHAVGHDWGAVILWSYISNPKREKRVKSFTAVACPHPMLFFKNVFEKLFSFQPSKTYESLQQILKSYYIFLFQIPWIPELIWENFGEHLWKILMQNSGLSENDPMFDLTPDEIRAHTVNSINLYREAIQSGVHPLPKTPIQTPVALFIPEDDLAITPALYEKTESFVQNLTTFRIQANHWVHRERPDWFNHNLESFLKSV